MPETVTPQLGTFPGAMGLHTSRCVERLKAGKHGDTIDREQMTVIVGRSCEVGDKGYANVCSAIRHVERLHGVVWRWDKAAKAWRCLNDAERVMEATGGIKRAGRLIGRSIRVAASVNTVALTEDQRREHNLTCALAGMIRIASSGPARKRLSEQKSVVEPDAAAVLRLMSAGKG